MSGPKEEQRFIGKAEEISPQRSENRKLIFLFHIMETPGLALIHEETLREINRGLVQLIRRQTFEEIESFLLTTFQLLKANVRKYPHTSLQCIQVLGTEVFKRGNSRLVEAFLWESVRFGFRVLFSFIFLPVSGRAEIGFYLAIAANALFVMAWLMGVAGTFSREGRGGTHASPIPHVSR